MLVQKLVQLPVTSIEQRIKEEIENNPALEEAVETEWDAKDEQEINVDGDIETTSESRDEYDDAAEFMRAIS